MGFNSGFKGLNCACPGENGLSVASRQIQQSTHESESDYDDQGIGNVRQLNRKDRRITDNKM